MFENAGNSSLRNIEKSIILTELYLNNKEKVKVPFRHLFSATKRGRAAAVIIGVEAYEKSEHDKEILRLLAMGDKKIQIGEGYDIDTVLAEADLILSQEPS